ncbi:O-antigen ligase family protein [Planomicrobium okeanokoites]|uniref:O-antigen ligase family protein n=1 Tax=Planomicrobium okeanokoites TaxID=244 RepID=A0ABV7KT69_PLAOK|nr:O-antigen ligase family protein [Planomicrobium okeanokoites]TAA71586.1 hypothetical protein D2910_04725 [Planomicrobium okeanokoites]
MKLFKLVLSREFLFSLFLLVGSFKGAINIPFIDETALLLVVTVTAAVILLAKNNMSIPKKFIFPTVLFAVIVLMALLSLIYTPSVVYASDKMVRFGIISAWCFYGVFFLFKDEKSVIRFLLGFVTVAVLMGVNLLFNSASQELNFESSFASSYVTLARIAAMGSLILMMYFLFSKASRTNKSIAMIGALILFIPLVQSGARFPILILAAVLLSIPLSMIRIKKEDVLISKKLIPLMLIFFILLGVSFFYASKGYADTLINRMEILFEQDGGGASFYGRTERFDTAWDMSVDSYFVGKGIGSFPIYHSGLDAEDYPHTIYLEILSELGIVPLLLFISLILMAIVNGLNYYRLYDLSVMSTSIYAMFVFWLFNSLGSSSLNGDKVFYALIAIMIILPYLGRNSEIKGTELDETVD